MSEETFGYDSENGIPVVLGRGATGNTYRGWIKVVNGTSVEKKPAALKEIINVNENGNYSLKREVHLLAQTRSLRHPCLVKYLRLIYPNLGAIIATELIEGVTLQALVDDCAVNQQYF